MAASSNGTPRLMLFYGKHHTQAKVRTVLCWANGRRARPASPHTLIKPVWRACHNELLRPGRDFTRLLKTRRALFALLYAAAPKSD
ncbi:hypothetical protein DV737_g5055, partial [Chaetothyriales sp. CBS 132003]